MGITLRRIEPAELAKFAEAQAISFGADFHPELVEKRDHIFEYDRSVAAFDGADIVGTAGAFSFEMDGPGRSGARGGCNDGLGAADAPPPGRADGDDDAAAGRGT